MMRIKIDPMGGSLVSLCNAAYQLDGKALRLAGNDRTMIGDSWAATPLDRAPQYTIQNQY